MDIYSPFDSSKAVVVKFVNEYYSVLKNSPQKLHQFYNDTSRIGRPIRGKMSMTVSTLRDIKEDLNPLNSQRFKSVEVISFNCQRCSIGFLVVVQGYFTSDERHDGRFVHIFFLASEDSKYFIKNDMLEFVDERKTKGGIIVSEASDSTVNNDAVEQRVLELKTMIEDVTDSAGFVPSSMPAPKDQGQSSFWHSTTDIKDFLEMEDVPDSAGFAPSSMPAPKGQVQRSSCDHFLDIEDFLEIKDAPDSAGFAPSSIPAPLNQGHCSTWDPIIEIEDSPKSAGSTPSSMPAPIDQGQHSSCDPSPATQANAIAVRTDDTGNGNNQQSQEVNRRGVLWISDLPPDTTPEIIKATFKQFGALKRDGSFHFVTKADGRRCYSVEFREASAAQKAVEASPINIKGQLATVELMSTRMRTVTEMYKLKEKSNTTTQSKT